MEWYYLKDGQQMGPVSAEQLAEMKNSGGLAPTELVWTEGMTEWQPINSLAEFGGSGAPAPQAQVPAQTAAPSGMQPKIDSYLWQSIVVTLLCCLPFGVAGIVFAAKVDSLVAAGDIAGAQAAAAKAKKFTIIGFFVGLAFVIGYIGLVMLGALAGA